MLTKFGRLTRALNENEDGHLGPLPAVLVAAAGSVLTTTGEPAAARNRAQRSELRTAIKRVRAAATKADAEKALVEAGSILDRAGRKNLVHRRNAARMKSRLAAAVAALK